MARTTVSSFFYAFTFLQILASSQAAWLPRTNVLPRQAGAPPPAAIPPQCESVCTPALAALQACTPPTVSCLCPQSLQGGLFNCFSCAGTAGNETDYSVPQMEIDEITVACDQAGMPLPKKTFPGQNPNRALSTAATGPVPTLTTSIKGSSSQTAATTGQSTAQMTQAPGTTQTAPTVPLSIGTPSTAAPTSGTSTTTAPTTTSGSNATKGLLPMWMVISGVLLGSIIRI